MVHSILRENAHTEQPRQHGEKSCKTAKLGYTAVTPEELKRAECVEGA